MHSLHVLYALSTIFLSAQIYSELHICKGINIFKFSQAYLSWVILCIISYLLSLSLRSCRADQALDMWWLSAHLGHRTGCRLLSHPQMLLNISSRMRAPPPSPLTKSKLEFTTTREMALSVQWPRFTQQRKVNETSQLYSKPFINVLWWILSIVSIGDTYVNICKQ